MAVPSHRARLDGQRWWIARTPEERATLTEDAFARVERALVRWIGADGYRVLLERALEDGRTLSHSLANVRCERGAITGLSASLREHEATAAGEPVVTLLTQLLALLSRVVIDSISGFEMALAPTFREDFRESLYRLVSTLTSLGVTILLTVEVLESEMGLRFTNYGVSFLTDDIIVQRYVEIEGQLRKVLVIVKMRGSRHSRDLRSYEITGNGIAMGDLLREYDGIMTGVPTLPARLRVRTYPGLNDEEMRILQRLVESGAENLETLSAITGVEPNALRPILDRLLQLAYVSRTPGTEEDARYQGLARMNTT